MKVGSDQKFGLISLILLATCTIYYTFWVIVVPFIDRDHYLLNYFPPREYAILGVVLLLMTIFCTELVFIGIILIKESQRKDANNPPNSSNILNNAQGNMVSPPSSQSSDSPSSK